MNIRIEYESCWQNSVLDNKTRSPNSKVREFNKSKTGGNSQPITKNTVMGVLYRLIGDQRTLNQIRNSDNHYFSDIEENIEFKLKKEVNFEELVMIINKSNDRCSDKKYIGVIRDDAKLFFSPIAPKLWSVLCLGTDEVMGFINNPSLITVKASSMPRNILKRIADIQKLDPLETMEKLISEKRVTQDKQKARLITLQDDSKTKPAAIDKINESIGKTDDIIEEIQKDEIVIESTKVINSTLLSLSNHFPEIPREDYIKKGGEIRLIRLYAAALYLQADLLIESGGNMEEIYVLQTKGKNKGKKTIQGFSRKGFNGVRDFLNPLSTGGVKKTVKTPFSITKASGTLEVTLNIEQKRAEKTERMINDAAVSSFYLGKKGLAFVSDINVMNDS